MNNINPDLINLIKRANNKFLIESIPDLGYNHLFNYDKLFSEIRELKLTKEDIKYLIDGSLIEETNIHRLLALKIIREFSHKTYIFK